MARSKTPVHVETHVVTATRRRCPLCVFLNCDIDEKAGQIAHLNGKSDDSRLENLVWLCLEHHSNFDSHTSQHKNYTPQEVKQYWDQLVYSFARGLPMDGRNFLYDHESKSQALFFDGIISFGQINEAELQALNTFTIKMSYAIPIDKYGGTLISFFSRSGRLLARVRMCSPEHPDFPSMLVLYGYHKAPGAMDHAALSINPGWNNLSFMLKENVITVESSNHSVSISRPRTWRNLQKIQLGNCYQSCQRGDPLHCKLLSFHMIDDLKYRPLYNFDFRYGEEVFLLQNKADSLCLFNKMKGGWSS